MDRSRPLALAALVALSSIAGIAHATVVVPLTLADQVARSELIVRARVGAQHSAYVAERGAILTWTELEITDVLKGQVGSVLTLRQMGGTADGRRMLVPGDAHLAPGSDVVLFLRQSGDDVVLFALAQSAYRIDGGDARRDLSELTFAVLGQDAMQMREPAHEAAVPVERLLSDIRLLVGGAS